MAGSSSRRQQNRSLLLARSTRQRQRREANRNRQQQDIVSDPEVARSCPRWCSRRAARSLEVSNQPQIEVAQHVQVLTWEKAVGPAAFGPQEPALAPTECGSEDFDENDYEEESEAEWDSFQDNAENQMPESRTETKLAPEAPASLILASEIAVPESQVSKEGNTEVNSTFEEGSKHPGLTGTMVSADQEVDETGAWLDFNGVSYEIMFEDGNYIFVQPSVGHRVVLSRAFDWLVGEINGNMIRLKLTDDGELVLHFKQKGWFTRWQRLRATRQANIAQSSDAEEQTPQKTISTNSERHSRDSADSMTTIACTVCFRRVLVPDVSMATIEVAGEIGARLGFNRACYEIAFENGKFIFVQPYVGHCVVLLRAFDWFVGEIRGNMIRLKLTDEGELVLHLKQKGWFTRWQSLPATRHEKTAQ